MIGSQILNYRIVEKLGDGGMGSVYKAVDEMLEREVALKFLRPELAQQPDLVERFRAEAVVLARLTHQNIAALFGLHRHGDDLFMAMEFVPGKTVEALLKKNGMFPVAHAVRVASHVLHALDYAHRRGVVHRDIKAANVIVTPTGNVKVMDFGIARVLGTERRTRVGFVVGTIGYMAPEQIQGLDVDGRTDIYSVGVALYEMLTGRMPFQGTTEWEVMQAQVQQMPVPPRQFADVPPAVETCVMKALAKNPADRYQTAAEFNGVVQAALRLGSTAPPGSAAFARSADETREFKSDPALQVMPPGGTPPATPAWPGTPAPPSGSHGAVPGPPPLTPVPVAPPPVAPAVVAPPAPAPLDPAPASRAVSPRTGVPDAAGAAAEPPAVPMPPKAPVAQPGAARAPAPKAARSGPSPAVFVLAGLLAVAVLIAAAVAGWQMWQARATAPVEGEVAESTVPAEDPAGEVPEGPPPGDTAASSQEAAEPPPAQPANPPAPQPSTRPPAGAAAQGTQPADPAPRPRRVQAPEVPAATAARPEPPPPAPPEPQPPPVAPAPAPARPALPPATFNNVKWMRVDGVRIRESDVLLQLDTDDIKLLDRRTRTAVATVPLSQVSSALYSQGKRARWRSDVGPAPAASVFDDTVRTFHYVAFQGASQFLLTRVERGDLTRLRDELRKRSSLSLDLDR